MPAVTDVAIVHDYLTQRGGAERVVLAMARALPDAPVFTTLYDPGATFPDFRDVEVRTTWLDRVPTLRRHHRLAFPFLAPVVSTWGVDADVVLCSSSGWAHGVRTSGRKVVYCHSPARWVYQRDRYAGDRSALRAALQVLAPPLRWWDVRAAKTADRYLANSSVVAAAVREHYGIDAEVVAPPVAVDIDGPAAPVTGIEPGAFLCVSRLLSYKNVDAVVEAFAGLPDERLVVVGDGPERARLRARAPANVQLVGTVDDARLRWLYRHTPGLVAAAYEDFGLTPLEAAAHGRPSAVLRAGGYLDTVVEDATGVMFAVPTPDAVADAVRRVRATDWDESRLRAHAAEFGEARFAARLREVVAALSA
jgi:glycosyltransferase involved in cell wall biosynthesis